MSIRAKITLLVLLVGLSEAILLGVIGYNSVATVSRSAAELRRISAAIEGARSLNVSLSGLSDPVELLLRDEGRAPERFAAEIDGLRRQVSTCSATSCHGYEKRPPEMAGRVLSDLATIRTNGMRILDEREASAPPPLAQWAENVDGPSRRVARMTGEMSETLMAKTRELETASREAERSALLLVAAAALVCVLAAVAVCHPLARGITRPLERLAEETRRIAGGNFERRAEEAGPRETVLLARSFNRMTGDLARHQSILLEHQNHLERMVDDRIAELRRKDEQLRRVERLAGIGLVAGTVAHDLNNPLTNVLLNAEALRDRAPEGGPERGIAERILADARRCREIAGGVRALGRETEIARLPCDPAELAQEAVRLLRHQWEPRRVEIRCVPPAGAALECLCEPPKILQLLVNLVENAVDASPDGGTVEVRLRTGDRRLTIEVEDAGPGIPPDRRNSLFRAFFTTKSSGTGLGLAISRRIAEQHEGTLTFRTRIAGEADGDGPLPHGTILRAELPMRGSGSHCAAPA